VPNSRKKNTETSDSDRYLSGGEGILKWEDGFGPPSVPCARDLWIHNRLGCAMHYYYI